MLALDVAQVGLIGRMLRSGELRIEGGKLHLEAVQLPLGKVPVAAEARPEEQQRAVGILVRDVVDHLVEELLLVHGQIVEGKQFAPLKVVLRIELEQQFEQGRRHLEVVDQEVVDGRSPDQLERRA